LDVIGKVNTTTTATTPGLNLGTAIASGPTSAANGDIWITNAASPKLAYRIGGVNYYPAVANQFNTFSGGVAISGTTTTPQLQITQLGTGHALVVEDTTSPDAQSTVIDQSGNVGIGTSSPAGKIDCVTGSTGQPIYFRREDNGNQNVQIYNDSGGGYVAMGGSVAKEFSIKNLNAAAINVIAGSNGVYLANAATSWASLSDERTKDIIENITDASTKISSLRAVIGKYKTDSEGTRRSFLIAQDVQAVLPEAVDATNPDKLGLQYSDIIPLLVASIKELTQRVAALESSN
jgi:hypothetical protein